MFRNYWKTAFRNLLKNKAFTFLNIAGLALGLTAFFLIVLYIVDEHSYDTYNTKANRIYRVNTDLKLPTATSLFAIAAPAVGNAIKDIYHHQLSINKSSYDEPGKGHESGVTILRELASTSIFGCSRYYHLLF